MTTPQRYRKKPVEIEAMQWDGTALGATPIINWILRNDRAARYWCREATNCGDDPHFIQIETLEGAMLASPGDWIIRGVAGEFYPCKPDVFAQTHEPAD
ncbi:hypothetical protein [Prescottella agglutinans]|uniref:Phage protein n=1 Tax=Prescottella agglutinans TaxID=1644129 RepID=A0ABT6MG55_9NOCA|nr:hypothetical protein [Prescottella agglutinans]MDH6282875.1 hypothetical protein [Prescottella agglutinans]